MQGKKGGEGGLGDEEFYCFRGQDVPFQVEGRKRKIRTYCTTKGPTTTPEKRRLRGRGGESKKGKFFCKVKREGKGATHLVVLKKRIRENKRRRKSLNGEKATSKKTPFGKELGGKVSPQRGTKGLRRRGGRRLCKGNERRGQKKGHVWVGAVAKSVVKESLFWFGGGLFI